MIDISLGISPHMLVWPGNPAVEILANQRISEGDEANVSELRLGTHTGTHVDPPVHFVPGGAGIDRVPLDALVGDAVVADLRGHDGPLGPVEFEGLGLPGGVERLLLRTDNSELWRGAGPTTFPDTYTSVSAEGAAWIVDRGIRLVGIDFLSIEQRGAPGHPTHTTLLGSGVVIVEGLSLGQVEPGAYRLTCLPLRVIDGDGGPARAILVQP